MTTASTGAVSHRLRAGSLWLQTDREESGGENRLGDKDINGCDGFNYSSSHVSAVQVQEMKEKQVTSRWRGMGEPRLLMTDL